MLGRTPSPIFFAQIAGVEAHGSATPLGDALELQGLRAALHADGRPPLRLTCVKPRLGHLEGCAGLAGLAAAVLQLQRCTTDQSWHFPNLWYLCVNYFTIFVET